jgi:cell division protein ZapE
MADFQPFDTAQREVSELLLGLHRSLQDSPWPAAPKGLRGRLTRWLGTPVTPVTGLYLWGGVGRGKTYLMDWFVRDLDLHGKRRQHFHHFMRDIHARLACLPRQPDPLEVIAEGLCAEVRVLCLDEFLVTDITDAMILHGLLSALFARGLTLVTTANTAPADLYRNGLQRQRFLPAIALLEQHTRVFELDGGLDYRLRTLTEGEVFFVTDELGAQETDRRLADYFDRLTGGHQAEGPGLLELNGRTLPLRRRGADVIWLDFDALCGTPRSVADYIEIAREYHSVLLSGVPVLGPRQEAAARRFVPLIDEFYDQRVKLVLSAAAPVERLYAGGLIDFPHQRLISRLIEMRSADYLAADGTGRGRSRHA